MTKKILAVIGIGIITATMLSGCNSKDVDADTTSSTVSTSQTTTSAATTTKPAESTTTANETTAAKSETTAPTKAAVNKTTVQNTTRSTTAAATERQTTTAVQTTKATTKPTTQITTVKNVTAAEVQAQVNSYIRSKGVTVDSSLRPDNAGWSGHVTKLQEDLNDGTSLRLCKEFVNEYISEMGTDLSMYCYYDDRAFYVFYL